MLLDRAIGVRGAELEPLHLGKARVRLQPPHDGEECDTFKYNTQ